MFGTLQDNAVWVSYLDTWAGSDFYPFLNNMTVSIRIVLS